jgi:hypothetical protein
MEFLTQIARQIVPWQPTEDFSRDLYEFTLETGSVKRLRIHIRPVEGSMEFEVLSGGYTCGTFGDLKAAKDKYNDI